MKPTFYITTAIPYASGKPHIGNAYDPALADMIARYKRMAGFDVYFGTGTDEHGQKIELAAQKLGVTPQQFANGTTAEIRAVWDGLHVEYDHFIRTTDADHMAAVQKIFRRLYEQDDIYKSEYVGKYCIPDESFYTESQLVDGKCPDCGRDVIDAKEEAYFLRLSKYADRLLAYYDDHPDFVKPDSRRNEMVNNFIKPGLKDLCVSRTSFTWGVPVDFDPGHVVYVWIDALSNYITALGFDSEHPGELYQKYWPADLHVIGKDVARFHMIYWPIMLMALGLPLPTQVLAHPWLLMYGDKLSKSAGNVMYSDELIARYGVDAVRYYLLTQIPYAQDGSVTPDTMRNVYNTDLANTLGNLVSRTAAMANQYFGGTVEKSDAATEFDADLFDCAARARAEYVRLMDAYRNADALDAVMTLARRCNKYIDETAPWTLAKSPGKRDTLGAVLYNLCECIRQLTVLLAPTMPDAAGKIRAMLGQEPDGLTLAALEHAPASFTVTAGAPLFPRIKEEDSRGDRPGCTGEQQAELATSPRSPAESKTPTAKPAVAPPAPEGVTTLAQIDIDEFRKVELRVASIVKCEPVKRAKKLLEITLDDGSPEGRTIVSGIAQWYTPDQLVGRGVVVVANLKPAVLCGVESRGMLLAADVNERAQVLFADELPVGSRLR